MASADTNRIYTKNALKYTSKHNKSNHIRRKQPPNTQTFIQQQFLVYTLPVTNLIKGTVRAAYFHYQVLHVALVVVVVVVVRYQDSLELTGTTHVTVRLLQQERERCRWCVCAQPTVLVHFRNKPKFPQSHYRNNTKSIYFLCVKTTQHDHIERKTIAIRLLFEIKTNQAIVDF